MPAVQDGRILGHEGVGTITEVGSAISSLSLGDRVIISCISACGHCDMCKERVFSHCLADEGASGIGWIFGHLIDGTQAEYVRVPFAETSVYPLPDGVTPQEGAMLSDILPTGHEIGVRYGQVKVGDVVVVIGAGPVGLAAIMTARLYGPSKIVAVDLDANRVEQAKRFGATHGVLSSDADWKEQVMALTDGLGVDVAIEAVGIPRTFEMCYQVVRPAGHIANVGVHGTGVSLPLDTLWISNITIAMGAGEHRHHRDVAEDGRRAHAARRPVRKPHLRPRRHRGGLRRVRAGRRDARARGSHSTPKPCAVTR